MLGIHVTKITGKSCALSPLSEPVAAARRRYLVIWRGYMAWVKAGCCVGYRLFRVF